MKPTIVNGYEIQMIYPNEWGCMKLGATRGYCFKSKKSAIAYANAN